MRRTTAPIIGAVLAIALVFASALPASARASATATAPFKIKVGVSTSTRFEVIGDGKVTVTSRATGGGVYFVQVQREDCGSFGCHGYKLVGDRKQLSADGVTRTVTLSPGNNSRQHKIWISKANNGVYISGTITFK